MITTSNAQTVYSLLDKVRIALSVTLVLISVAGFYFFSKEELWLRVVILVAGLILSVINYAFTDGGKQLIAYAKDSVGEVKKVVWPTRQEALQMTGYVFAFVVVMALLLWLTDKTLEWLLYSVILGWTR